MKIIEKAIAQSKALSGISDIETKIKAVTNFFINDITK
jgi:hypothetical protein